MTEHMPESYWNDVNRYCGELMAGAAVVRRSVLVAIRTETATVSWPGVAQGTAEPETELKKETARYFGIMPLYSAYKLTTQQPLQAKGPNEPYAIYFDPAQEQVLSAHVVSPARNYELDPNAKSLKEFSRSFGTALGNIRADYRSAMAARALGLHRPSTEDCELLLSELHRGVTHKVK